MGPAQLARARGREDTIARGREASIEARMVQGPCSRSPSWGRDPGRRGAPRLRVPPLRLARGASPRERLHAPGHPEVATVGPSDWRSWLTAPPTRGCGSAAVGRVAGVLPRGPRRRSVKHIACRARPSLVDGWGVGTATPPDAARRGFLSLAVLRVAQLPCFPSGHAATAFAAPLPSWGGRRATRVDPCRGVRCRRLGASC